MFFFDRNLKAKHKVTLCLAVLAILANYWVCAKLVYTIFGTYPFVELLKNEEDVKMLLTGIVLSSAIFSQMLLVCIFRKF